MTVINIAILDYSIAKVFLYSGVKIERSNQYQSEDVEKWIVENTDHNLDEIEYMTSENDIEVETI